MDVQSRHAGKTAPSQLGRDTGFPYRAAVCLRPRAFTLVEVLVVVFILALFVAIMFAVIGKTRNSGQSVTCLSNLRQITLSFQTYANANQSRLPPPSDPNVANQSWESLIKPYTGHKEVFRCPADTSLYDKMGSSYDWRDTGDPRTTAAGKIIAQIRRGNVIMAFDAMPEWHGAGTINASFADGSARTVSFEEWAKELFNPID